MVPARPTQILVSEKPHRTTEEYAISPPKGSVGKSPADKQALHVEPNAYDTKAMADALTTSGITAKDKPTSPGSPGTNVAAAVGSDVQRDTAETRLWVEVKDLIAAFGPLDGAVKIKMPNSNEDMIVHGCLLIGKSYFCRAALINGAKQKDAKELTLTLPSNSAVTLLYFIRWVYNDNVLPVRGDLFPSHASRRVTWPDLVDLWIFADEMGTPKLQNHAVDILVRKANSFLDLLNGTKEEVDHILTVYNKLWPAVYQAQGQPALGAAAKPLRTLMLDWFANPLYQTKANADQLWAAGLPWKFYQDFASSSIDKNFSIGECDLQDEADPDEHMEAMEEVSQQELECLWEIKAENYYVDDKTFAAPMNK